MKIEQSGVVKDWRTIAQKLPERNNRGWSQLNF
jgi:hypothetical protein